MNFETGPASGRDLHPIRTPQRFIDPMKRCSESNSHPIGIDRDCIQFNPAID
jgi:hypothetical protein